MSKLLDPVLREARSRFGVIATFSLFANLLMLTAPLFMLQLFDRVLTSRSLDTLLFLLLIAVFALAVMSALEVVRGIALARLAAQAERKLAAPALLTEIRTTLQHGKAPTSQAIRDLSSIRSFVASPSIYPIFDAPWSPVFLAMMFVLHPFMGWLSLAGMLALFTLAIVNERLSRGGLTRASEHFATVHDQAETAIRNADAVEAMGMLRGLLVRWHGSYDAGLMTQTGAGERIVVLASISKFIRLCLQIGLLSTGAYLVLMNELTPGGMIAGTILMSRALAPVEQSISAWRSFVGARAAYRRLHDLLVKYTDTSSDMEMPAPDGRVVADKLTYTHPGSDQPCLAGLDFEISPGESLGIMGRMASGKSTLARLLVGNIRPSRGSLTLDGMEISAWRKDNLGPYMGYLPQDVELFPGSVRLNIARMQDGAPDDVISAAKLAGVHDAIAGLPNGYDTEIGVAGLMLSGGERQRIGLARAVYGNPKVVVLDEPNANLDGEGEQALVECCNELRRRKTTLIVIAQRWGILSEFDKILVLEGGRLLHFGDRKSVFSVLQHGAARPARQSGQSQ